MNAHTPLTDCPMCLGVPSTHGSVPRTAFNETSEVAHCMLCNEVGAVEPEIGAVFRVGGLYAATGLSNVIAKRVQRQAWRSYEHHAKRMSAANEARAVITAVESAFRVWRRTHQRNEASIRIRALGKGR